MSTRSCIFVEVKKEDFLKRMKPDKEMLYAKGYHFGDVDSEKRIPEEEVDKVPATELSAKYIGIYHHWDGYPDGVGETLVNKFNTYEEALNLMLFGDQSTINREDELLPYWLRGAGYKKSEDTPPMLESKIPMDLGKTHWAEYVYLFKNGEWYFDRAYYEKRKRYTWKKLADYLAKEKEKEGQQ